VIAIVLSVCLMNDPAICHEETIPVVEQIDSRQCVLSAMPYAAQWGSDHPEWKIVRWSCRAGGEKEI
jgi:hypothetical protein